MKGDNKKEKGRARAKEGEMSSVNGAQKCVPRYTRELCVFAMTPSCWFADHASDLLSRYRCLVSGHAREEPDCAILNLIEV